MHGVGLRQGRTLLQGMHVSGDAARDAPGLRYHKPKTPIGRRGESLIHLRTTRARIEPRRPRFTCPKGQRSLKPEAMRPAGASARPAVYSLASATTGSSRAAERAGMKPNPTPISVEEMKAATIVVGE